MSHISLEAAINDGIVKLIQHGANFVDGVLIEVNPAALVPAHLAHVVKRNAEIPLSPIPIVKLTPRANPKKFRPVEVYVSWWETLSTTFSEKVRFSEAVSMGVV